MFFSCQNTFNKQYVSQLLIEEKAAKLVMSVTDRGEN